MQLTDEQLQIIHHPDGHHGKVLSVAGSGKTTTMAHRVKHLLDKQQVPRHQIQVLMFNRAARNQFVEKLDEIGIPVEQQPQVNTFHSYSYRVIKQHSFKQWFGDTEELAHLALVRAVEKVRRDMDLDDDELDVDEAKQSIGLWKGALIPPSRAGYAGPNGDAYVSVYREFEKERLNANAITFDDFVPWAVNELEVNLRLRRFATGQLKYIIVDEYQDINLGQQKLIECLASTGADLMVVGDDDQTIYEWRGARSDYILGEFDATFSDKPHITYKLTNSFRFGYVIAQSSYNVIIHNAKRLDKQLLSSNPASDSNVTLITDRDVADGYANRSLVEEILSLVLDKGVSPSDIRVLVRTYAQAASFSTELMLREIPSKVMGRASFLQAGECRALLNYVRVAAKLCEIPSDTTKKQFLNIANKPSRYLLHLSMERMIEEGRQKGFTLGKLLQDTIQDNSKFSNLRQRYRLEDLTVTLETIHRKLNPKESGPEEPQIGPLLNWIDEEVGFQQHYQNYYGNGEASLTRMKNVQSFINYANSVGMTWQDFIEHVEKVDTTFGLPEEEWLKIMTIHSTKGLEFDYVVIPNCEEGYLPVIGSNDDPTYDTADPRRTPKAAEWIESERRLFYVGATRAKKGLFIGAPALKLKKDGSQDSTPKSGEQSVIEQGEIYKSSRFLEEMELEPTKEVAAEMVRAAKKDPDNKLVEVCRRLSAYHHIVGTVKKLVGFFSSRDREQVEQVELSSAERPFGYRQEYTSPFNRSVPTSAIENSRPQQSNGPIWGHIDIGYKKGSTRN